MPATSHPDPRGEAAARPTRVSVRDAVSYVHLLEEYADQLERQLSAAHRQGAIEAAIHCMALAETVGHYRLAREFRAYADKLKEKER